MAQDNQNINYQVLELQGQVAALRELLEIVIAELDRIDPGSSDNIRKALEPMVQRNENLIGLEGIRSQGWYSTLNRFIK